MSSPPIESHAVIGDLHTVALVAMDGAVDFLCAPDFDSPSIFASLLDSTRGGRFRVAPILEEARQKQLYLPDTNVVLTRFLSREGVAEVTDFMPVAPIRRSCTVIRRATTVRGEIGWRMTCAPRFDYGRAEYRVERTSEGVVFSIEKPKSIAFRLRTTAPVLIENGVATSELNLRCGQSVDFVLEEVVPGELSPAASLDYVSEALRTTSAFWRRWLARSTYRGRWRETVDRSALMLKLLTSEAHGSIVAAPTFGLPEEIGGERNWDYRYTWIRDASFTLYALLRLGFPDEANAFLRWLEARCHELGDDGSLQIMYGIDGRHRLTEEHLTHLAGYGGSAPVRVGNGAWDQLQLDIYGELMDSIYLANKYAEPVAYDLWRNLVRMVEYVCRNWRVRDNGIWEVRGGMQEFLHSRVMCWVAVDRAIRLAQKRSFPAPLDRWHRVRDEIFLDVRDRFWHPGKGAFVQHVGSSSLDAAALLMPLVKFFSPTDPRWLSTLRAIERELVDDSLVYRYRVGDSASDGLLGEEGTFSICSFWYVECLSRAGELERARYLFEKAIGYANHVGLFAEELGPRGEHLGNFPQAFTHLALISAAYDLDRRLSGAANPRV